MAKAHAMTFAKRECPRDLELIIKVNSDPVLVVVSNAIDSDYLIVNNCMICAAARIAAQKDVIKLRAQLFRELITGITGK